jgi:peptidyl-dipeptidase Dcp
MAAMAEEIERIAGDPDAPTFENTLEALERAGTLLDRVTTIFRVWGSTLTGPEFQALEREMNPRLAAHRDRIYQDQRLFQRIEAVYGSPEMAGRSDEQQRLAWRYHTDFVRMGARLDDGARARVSEINQALSGLFTSFSANVLADEAGQFLVLEDEAELAGLPEWLCDAARTAAEEKELPGKWVISNTRSSAEPFITYSSRRDLRERVWRMFNGRGDMGGDHDNNEIITEILALRSERARLLGYPTHAHYFLETSMAGSPERAIELMDALWEPAVSRVRAEVHELQALASEHEADVTIQPWDYRFYAEKLRQRRFAVDQGEVSQYLQLERLLEGMFWLAEELFGMRFEPADDAPKYHRDVRVWAVRAESGKHLGLFYFDPFARSGKRSGAWMNVLRAQGRVNGDVPTIVSNVLNVLKSRPGEPVLLSWRDASTLFHEFGHAINGLASDVTYPLLSGTPPERDYVEFPSQILEHWLSTPEIMLRYAVHHETGEPIPLELIERIDRTEKANQGLATVEYLASAIVDMKLHLAEDHPVDARQIERETLERYGMPPQVCMRHRLPHFAHIFAGDGYSAAYYSYLWADVLTADGFEAFAEAGGPFDREVAQRLIRHVLSAGSTVDPAEGYRRFRGRDPRLDALMRKRGFATAA